MVTHDMELAGDTDRRIHLVDGRIHTDKKQE
jgi:predicted ABC-type transport system involved in lysophospholipase L1 biosynthesis ATPase subunit